MTLPSCFLILLLVSGFEGNLTEILPAIGQVLAGENSSNGDINVKMEGSGVVIESSGLVITNYHVISNGSKPYSSIWVNLVDPANPYKPPDRARLFKAEILRQDTEEDLVILRLVADINGLSTENVRPFKFLPLGNSKNIGFLEEIYTLGFPKAGGATVTMTRGQISGKEELEGWLKIDAQVTHGSSGGAVINKNGELIGISTKVRPDIQEIDTNGDGFPDTTVNLGSVGLIRPVEMVAAMLGEVKGQTASNEKVEKEHTRIEIKGLVQDAEGNSVAKALVGLLKAGSQEATVENLLTWTRADESGVFHFPYPIPPGVYTIRARADGYKIYLESIELTAELSHPVIKLVPLSPAPPPAP
jgi:S1-C subfamily serine protease